MSDISGTDMRFLDDVFEMHGGEPLDFSIRTLDNFFRDEFGISLYVDKYTERGTSKANRLRTFLANEPNQLAAKALQALWDYRELLDVEDPKPQVTKKRYAKLMVRLGATLEGTEIEEQSIAPTKTSISDESRSALAAQFRTLHTLQPHPRGFAFEKFLNSLFNEFGLNPRGSFRKTATQIDGSFVLDNELYLLEAKWQSAQTDAADIFTFEGKVGRGASWTRGLFISHGGFTKGAIAELGTGRSIVCLDGLDLHDGFERGLDFDEIVRRKVRRAGEQGTPFVSVRELFK